MSKRMSYIRQSLTGLTALIAFTSPVLGEELATQYLADQHLGARITNAGLHTLLKSIVNKYSVPGYTNKTTGTTFNLDKDGLIVQLDSSLCSSEKNKKLCKKTLKLTREKHQPMATLIKDLLQLDLKEGVPVWLKDWSLTAAGKTTGDDISLTVSNLNDGSVQVIAKAIVRDLKLSLDKLSLCTTKDCSETKGFKASIQNMTAVHVADTPELEVQAKMTFKSVNGKLTFKMSQLTSNLSDKNAPKLYVDLKKIILPPVYVEANGKKIQLSTNALKSEILNLRKDIAKAVTEFGAEFIANDLEKIVRNLLESNSVDAGLKYKFGAPKTYNFEQDVYTVKPVQDNLERSDYILPRYDTIPQLGEYKNFITKLNKGAKKPMSEMDKAMIYMRNYIWYLDFSLSISEVKVRDGNLDISTNVSAMYNYYSQKLGNTLGHGKKKGMLSPISYSTSPDLSKYEFALAISEPYINSVLQASVDTGIANDLLEGREGMEGIWIHPTRGVKAHLVREQGCIEFEKAQVDTKFGSFSGSICNKTGITSKIYVVVNLILNLQKRGEFWGNIIEYWWGDGGIIEFPLEIAVTPVLEKDSNTGEYYLWLATENPFAGGELKNRYGYPSNLDKITGVVKDSFYESLIDNLKGISGKRQRLPLKKWLGNDAISFEPARVSVENSGHVVVYGKLKKIDWNKLEGMMK